MTYVNYESLTVIGILLPCLGLTALGLRCYGRYRFADATGIDDVLVIPAAILTTALGITLVVGARERFIGGHTYKRFDEFKSSSSPQTIRLFKLQYGFWIIYDTAMSLTKLTFLFFFRRIFRGRLYRTAFDWTNWTLIIINILWVLVFDLLRIFRCGTNISHNWLNFEEQSQHCISPFTIMFASSVPNWIMDVAIFLEPLVMTFSLQMHLRRKLQASFIFLVSFLAVLAGLCRMIISIEVFHLDYDSSRMKRMLGIDFHSGDIPGILGLAFYWTYIELGIGFLVVCLLSCGRALDEVVLRPARKQIHRLSSRGSVYKNGLGTPSPSGGGSGISQASSQPAEATKLPGELLLMQIDRIPDLT